MKTFALANRQMRVGNEHAVQLSFKTRMFYLIIKHACSGTSIITQVGKCMSDNVLHLRRDL